MKGNQMRPNSLVSALKAAQTLWPYLFIAVSVAGLAYIALNAAH
jgi:hypothetical protein